MARVKWLMVALRSNFKPILVWKSKVLCRGKLRGQQKSRKVAEAYANKVAREPRRRQLDLQGKDLVYGGDTDIAYTGCEMGLAMGVFPELKVKHLTPPTRCTEEYLLKNYEAHAYSEVLHTWLEMGKIPPQRTDLRGGLGVAVRWMMGPQLERKMISARSRGLERAKEFVRKQGDEGYRI